MVFKSVDNLFIKELIDELFVEFIWEFYGKDCVFTYYEHEDTMYWLYFEADEDVVEDYKKYKIDIATLLHRSKVFKIFKRVKLEKEEDDTIYIQELKSEEADKIKRTLNFV